MIQFALWFFKREYAREIKDVKRIQLEYRKEGIDYGSGILFTLLMLDLAANK